MGQAFILAKTMTITVEKIHIFEYAVLGWIVCRDLTSKGSIAKGVILACLLCAGIGALDEAFQAVLPYRVFDLHDIQFNIYGSLEGVVIYLLSEK